MNRKNLTVDPLGTIAERATGVNETGEMGQGCAKVVAGFPIHLKGEPGPGAARGHGPNWHHVEGRSRDIMRFKKLIPVFTWA